MRRIEEALNISKSEPVSVRLARLKADIESGKLTLDQKITEAEGIVINPRDKSPSPAGEVYLIRSQAYRQKMLLSDAFRNACMAQEIFNKSGDVLSSCKAAFELANIDFVRTNYGVALERFLIIEQELSTMEITDDTFLSKLFLSIAMCAVEVHDYTAMRSYLDKSTLIIDSLESRTRAELLATKNYLLGVSLAESGAFTDAVDHFTRAAMFYEEVNDKIRVLRMRSNVARTLYKSGDLHGAESVAREVYASRVNTSENENRLVDVELLLAEVAFAKKDYEESLRLCRLATTRDSVDVSRKARSLRIKARVDYVRGDLKGFNERMTQAAKLLQGNYHLMPLMNEILYEFMLATTGHNTY